MLRFSIKSLAVSVVAAVAMLGSVAPAGAQTTDPAVDAFLAAVHRNPTAFGLSVPGTCYGTPVEPIVEQFFGHTPDYDHFMRVIIPRESGCDPCAYYPSQHNCAAPWPRTALGLFQLLRKDAMLHDACPLLPDAWRWPECSTIVAKWLYDGWRARGGSGLEPWGG